MSIITKINDRNDMCKIHSARLEKGLYRISPSKLDKKELEDLYFSLLDNNLQLKKTVNAQQEDIKLLSTRIQRISAQRSIYGKYEKNCCSQSQVIIKEQKEIISELKLTNEKLAEKVRLVNMRLCSAKQFLKRSPLQISKSHYYSTCSFRNSSNALNVKRSNGNLRMKSASSQYLDKDVTPLILEETVREQLPERDECTQNKCRTTVQELELEISNLKKKLSEAVDEYTGKIAEVQRELGEEKRHNVEVRAHCNQVEDVADRCRTAAQEVSKRLRQVEAENDNMKLELTLEKQKVRELQMELRAAEVSINIARAVRACSGDAQISQGVYVDDKQMTPTKLAKPTADDSGYAESSLQHRAGKRNTFMTEQIVDIQAQLDAMHILMEHGGGDNVALERNSDENELQSYASHCQPRSSNAAKSEGDDKSAQSECYVSGRRKNKSRKEKDVPSPIHKLDKSEKYDTDYYNRDTDRYEAMNVCKNNHKSKEDTVPIIGNVEEGDEDIRNDVEETLNYEKIKNYKDVAIQSAIDIESRVKKKCVSRGVGPEVSDDVANATEDVGVQINGNSLCEKIDNNASRIYGDRKSRSGSNRTYSVRGNARRSASGDNTQCEISSLTDLTADSKSSSDYISPGEERAASSTLSDTYDATSSDLELSEGELPVGASHRSYGEVKVNGAQPALVTPSSPITKVGEAIKAVKQELSRCNQMLDCSRGDAAALAHGANLFDFLKS